MDYSSCNFSSRNDECGRSGPQSLLASSVLVDGSSGRRLDRFLWISGKSHWGRDDFLEGAIRPSANYILCDILLSRECRSIPKPRITSRHWITGSNCEATRVDLLADDL